MAVTESQPTANNNTSSLTTSEDQTEQVGVSVGGGYVGGAASGVVGVNWSDSWTWSTSNTVNITDWTVSSSAVPGAPYAVQYQYAASGNTEDTLANLQLAGLGGTPSNGYNPPEFGGLVLGPTNLNPLQQSAMTAQDETVWKSSGGLVPPSTQTFEAFASFELGEVYQMPGGGSPPNYGNVGASLIGQKIVIDFSNPALQPPSPAPWTLTFGRFTNISNGQSQVTGTVSLPRATPGALTLLLSYVIQPQVPMLTLPSTGICPGNTTSFIPGNSAIDGGNPPLSITIPAGKTSATFQLDFATFSTSTYNVETVAWLPETTYYGVKLTNPQSAVCLTPLNSTPPKS